MGQEKHGGISAATPPEMKRLYWIWCGMKQRCVDPGFTSYARYGGRGISVCPEWISDFSSFRSWALSAGYKADLQIDRIDNDGNYYPDNCRWVTQTENMNNKSSSHFIEAFGEIKTARQWTRDPRCRAKYNTLLQRLKLGWDPERAIGSDIPRHFGSRPT